MSIEKVFLKFGDIVGHNHVFDQKQAIKMYGADTNGIERNILGALRPHSTEEVQKIVVIANRERIPLYPISTGHNWGYGTSLPVTDYNVIVDLSEMNAVVDFDKALGTVTLEPGVTQQNLYDFLEKHHHPYLVPLTGAGPKGSIVGNALERGFGITPYADHFSAVTTITAVLADGSIYRSPLEELGCTRIDRLYKYGIGPYLDGIFSQGNFGIVTEMTIALAHKPEITDMFFFFIKSPEAFNEITSEIPYLLSTLGTTMSNLKFVNREQVLSMDAGSGKKNKLGKKILPEWMCVGSLHGDKRLVKASKAILKERFQPHALHMFFIDANFFIKYYRILAHVPFFKKLIHPVETLVETITLFTGKPSTPVLPLSYNKSGTIPHKRETMDPAKDGAGLLWFAPLVPIHGKIATTYYTTATAILKKYDIAPLLTFTTLNDRVFDSPLPITFDKNNPKALAKAKACYNELWEASRRLGLMPYRLPIDEMHRVTSQDTPFWKMNTKIKKALDPRNIIAPGRYNS